MAIARACHQGADRFASELQVEELWSVAIGIHSLERNKERAMLEGALRHLIVCCVYVLVGVADRYEKLVDEQDKLLQANLQLQKEMVKMTPRNLRLEQERDQSSHS